MGATAEESVNDGIRERCGGEKAKCRSVIYCNKSVGMYSGQIVSTVRKSVVSRAVVSGLLHHADKLLCHTACVDLDRMCTALPCHA